MKNFAKKLLAVAMLSAIGAVAQAATLSVIPAAGSVNVGSSFNVTILISDLVDGAAPSLGDFDLDINFNSALLSYSGFSWGDSIHGDQLDLAQLGSFAQADTSQAATGKLNYFEISYDDVAALNNTQAGSFGLLTLTFNALALGSSSISIDVNSLGDAYGNALGAQVNNASVSAVPLPSALILFTSALLAMAGRTRRRNVAVR